MSRPPRHAGHTSASRRWTCRSRQRERRARLAPGAQVMLPDAATGEREATSSSRSPMCPPFVLALAQNRRVRHNWSMARSTPEVDMLGHDRSAASASTDIRRARWPSASARSIIPARPSGGYRLRQRKQGKAPLGLAADTSTVALQNPRDRTFGRLPSASDRTFSPFLSRRRTQVTKRDCRSDSDSWISRMRPLQVMGRSWMGRTAPSCRLLAARILGRWSRTPAAASASGGHTSSVPSIFRSPRHQRCSARPSFPRPVSGAYPPSSFAPLVAYPRYRFGPLVQSHNQPYATTIVVRAATPRRTL